MSHDLVTLGEAMFRLWVPPGARLENAPALNISVAGAEANVAIAMSRIGRRTAWLSRLPESALGRRAAAEIAAHGVDVSNVRWSDGTRMGTYYVELSGSPRATRVIYDRAGSAASGMSAGEIPWQVVEAGGWVHLTGITAALSSSCREMVLEVARRARAAGVPVSVDVNYRSGLWSTSEARPILTELCKQCDLVIITEEDAGDVFGISGTVEEVLAAVADLSGAPRVVLTRGAEGAAWLSEESSGTAESYDIDIVDRIGGGDAFAGGVIHGMLDGDLASGVEWGLAMAAIKLTMFGDQLRTDREEVLRLMMGKGREVAR